MGCKCVIFVLILIMWKIVKVIPQDKALRYSLLRSLLTVLCLSSLTFWVNTFEFYKRCTKTSYLPGLLRNLKRDSISSLRWIAYHYHMLWITICWEHSYEYIKYDTCSVLTIVLSSKSPGLKNKEILNWLCQNVLLHLKFHINLRIFLSSGSYWTEKDGSTWFVSLPFLLVSLFLLLWLWFLQVL